MNLVDEVVSQTAEVFQQPLAELRGRSRKRPIVAARQAAMWTIRQRYPSLSLYTIGMALGGRHYTTVMHAMAAVEARAHHDSSYRWHLEQLMERVTPPGRRTSYISAPIRSTTSVSSPCGTVRRGLR